MTLCYECDPKMKGGYNHKDCRKGKKDRKGKIQKCDCCCRTPGSKYVPGNTRLKK